MMGKRLIVAAYLLLCCGIVVYGLMHFINSPSEGTIKPVKQVVTPAVTTIPVVNTYASFSYPSNFSPGKTDKPVPPVLVAYSFVKQEVNPWSINILITHLASGSLDDDGSYRYRKMTPSRFKAVTETYGGQSVEIFTDTSAGNYSKAAYLHHGNLDASISISGSTADDGNASIDKRLNTIVSSWQWH